MLNGQQWRKTQDEIYHNTRIKQYPNGYMRVTVASHNIFRESGWEEEKKKRAIPQEYSKENNSRKDSVRRAKETVFDIATLNKFDYFVTLTLDPEQIDSKDTETVKHKLKSSLNNLRNRHNVSYLLVAEYHKSGAIHFHALMSGNLKLEDSGTVIHKDYSKPVKLDTLRRKGVPVDEAKTVYNVKNWTLGHSTAIEIYGEQQNVAKYMTKYITKDFQKIFGNFYYAGGNIIRKPQITLIDSDYNTVDKKEYLCEAIGVSFKYYEVSERGVQ